jgi:hypothetical protein
VETLSYSYLRNPLHSGMVFPYFPATD